MKNLIPKNQLPSGKNNFRCLFQKYCYTLLLILTIIGISSNQLLAQQTSISGKVAGKTGEALPGVTVLVKGTTNGTATDANGNFSLNVPNTNSTLVVSFIGYQTQEVAIGNRTTVNIKLAPDAKALDEVVVIGYGTQRREDVTSSVASVKSEEFQKGGLGTWPN